jgi:hypothetical protein
MLRSSFSLLVFLSACGSVSLLDNNLPPLPTITSFQADPGSFDAGGGATLLSWTVVNEDNLELDPGHADVSSFTSARVTLTTTTTYTLWAGNSLGRVSSNLTVTVGP